MFLRCFFDKIADKIKYITPTERRNNIDFSLSLPTFWNILRKKRPQTTDMVDEISGIIIHFDKLTLHFVVFDK